VVRLNQKRPLIAMTELVPIFADQLTHSLSALQNADQDKATVLMMEVREEAHEVWHHRKKLVFLFSAMRHFASELEDKGWTVRYVKLDEKDNEGSFTAEIARAAKQIKPDRILVTEPGEWRVEQMVRSWRDDHDLPVKLLRDNRFLSTKQEFADWAEGRKELRMEFFYREMRKATGLLMDGDKPVGGKWNFDKENRSPPKSGMQSPRRDAARPDDITRAVIEMVEQEFPDRFGSMDNFGFGVTADEARRALDHFISDCLPDFGTWQDAMLEGEAFLYHSLLSIYLNAGLLDPLTACKKAEAAWQNGEAPLNAVEGFIRQIIGWREYVRGIYWFKMPGYETSNALDANEDLPDFYWSGETGMNCLHEVVEQTREHAYSHHIQRLMITGNFALLAGIDPKQVHEWYLAVYADAFEWVEMPNTLGMALYADGGLLASKPYAASANYINRMSDFCGNCSYDPKKKTGDDACPFNSLYWDFLARNKDVLGSNHRMGMMYKNLERQDEEELTQLRKRAEQVLMKMRSGTL